MHIQTAIPSFASVVAFYGEPLPHELRGRGYMQAVCAARMMALRTVMAEPVIAWPGVAPIAAPAPAPVKRKAARVAKKLSAEEFFDAYQIARKAVCAAVGERWVVLGHARWATLPTGWRSFTGPRGGKVRLPKDIRIPAAEFWPGGVLPDGLTIAAPTPTTLTPWVVGYGADGAHVLMYPTLVDLQKTRAEQIAADAPRLRAAKARRMIDAARSKRRSCFHAIEYLREHPETGSLYGRTIASAMDELARYRAQLMDELRKL